MKPFKNISEKIMAKNSSFKKLETRECENLEQCELEIPKFKAIEMSAQSTFPTRVEAIFTMDEIDFIPYGQLYFQEMELKPIDTDFDTDINPNIVKWKSNEFNKTRIIQNLVVNMTYQPIIKVYTSLGLMNNQNRQGSKDVTDLLKAFYGEVSIFNRQPILSYVSSIDIVL